MKGQTLAAKEGLSCRQRSSEIGQASAARPGDTVTIVTDNELLLQLLNLEGGHELHLCVQLFIPKLQHLSEISGRCGLVDACFLFYLKWRRQI